MRRSRLLDVGLVDLPQLEVHGDIRSRCAVTLAQIFKLAHGVRSHASSSPEAKELAREVLALFSRTPPQDLQAMPEGGWVNGPRMGCVSPPLARAVARGLFEAADEADAQTKGMKRTRRGVGGR